MATTASKDTERPDRPRPRGAALVATILLIGSGVGYRAVASRVVEFFDIAPLRPGGLAQLPRQLSEWRGRDQPLDERVVDIVRADDHLSRVYERQGREKVSLFVALRRRDVAYGVPARELAPHRPR